MAHLPEMTYTLQHQTVRQAQFGRLQHCRSCSDGDIYDMENVTLDEFPLLKARKRRKRTAAVQAAVDGFYLDNHMELYVVGGELRERYAGTLLTNLQTGVRHRFVRFGNRVVLLPEMWLLNLSYKILGVKESASELPTEDNEQHTAYAVKTGQPNISDIYVWDGSGWVNNGRFDLPLRADSAVQPAATIQTNTLRISLPKDYVMQVLGFKKGDAVTISGCTTEPENNKTAIIREITGDTEMTIFRFSDYCFKIPNEENSYTEHNVRIVRQVPEMDFLFACENRLWGAKGKTIYASKMGDPTNWYFFDGLSIDSWSIELQNGEEILGGWGDYYPHFLRSDGMTIVYGTTPQGYQCADKHAVPGLKRGEEESIALAGAYTLWLSREGMVLYGNDGFEILKDTFRDWDLNTVRAVSAGQKAYFNCWVRKNHSLSETYHKIFCFDARTALWEIQSGSGCTEMAYYDGVLYGLHPSDDTSEKSLVFTLAGESDETTLYESNVQSYVEFGDVYCGSENRKASNLLLLRVEVEPSAELQIRIRYDSTGTYELLKKIPGGTAGAKKHTYDIPILPRRCDHYRIRLDGMGGWTLYAMTQQVKLGTERQ